MAQVVQALIERTWLAPLIPLALFSMLMARLGAWLAGTAIWNRWARQAGLPEAERHELIIAAWRRAFRLQDPSK